MLPVPASPQLPAQGTHDRLAYPEFQLGGRLNAYLIILGTVAGVSGAIIPEVNAHVPLKFRLPAAAILWLIACVPVLQSVWVAPRVWERRIREYPLLHADWINLTSHAGDYHDWVALNRGEAEARLAEERATIVQLQGQLSDMEDAAKEQIGDLASSFKLLLSALPQSERLSITIRHGEGYLVIEDHAAGDIQVGDRVLVLDKHNQQWLGAFNVEEIGPNGAYGAYARIMDKPWWGAMCEDARLHRHPPMNVVAVMLPQQRDRGDVDNGR